MIQIQGPPETVTLDRRTYDKMNDIIRDLHLFRAKVEASTGSDFDSFCYSKDFHGSIYWLTKDEGIKRLEQELIEARKESNGRLRELMELRDDKKGFWKRLLG